LIWFWVSRLPDSFDFFFALVWEKSVYELFGCLFTSLLSFYYKEIGKKKKKKKKKNEMTGFDGVRQKRFSSFLVFGAAVNWLYGPLPFFSFSLISFLLLFLSLLPLIPLSTSGQKVFYSL